MALRDLKDSQIKDNIKRLRAAGISQGRPYSLAELLQEQHRRAARSPIPVVPCAKAIIELGSQSPNGFVTYGQLWERFYPGGPWGANHSIKVIGYALDDVGFYCVRHGLPLIVTLVVNKSAGGLTDRAKDNIYNTWLERGAVAGIDRDTWIEDHQRRALALTLSDLPPDKTPYLASDDP
jgi:hypothetical protein